MGLALSVVIRLHPLACPSLTNSYPPRGSTPFEPQNWRSAVRRRGNFCGEHKKIVRSRLSHPSLSICAVGIPVGLSYQPYP